MSASDLPYRQVKAERPHGFKAAIAGALAGWYGRDIKTTDGDFWGAFFGTQSWSGKRVTVDSALQLSTVWACVRLISETLSTLPVNVMKDKGDGSEAEAKSHPLYSLVHIQPNADMTAAVFWQAIIASLLLWGNAYIEKSRTGSAITSLNFLAPRFVTPVLLFGGVYQYWYTDPFTRQTRLIEEADMWHIPAFTVDGRIGLSSISYGLNVLGSALATDEASARTFKQGMRASGVITMDEILNKEKRQGVREHVHKVSTDGGVLVLEKGSDFKQISMNPEDAQMLETRGLNVEEICRLFGVPPTMVGHSDRNSNWGTGIEQQQIGFLTFVLRPWAVRIEQSAKRSLLSPADRLTHSVEFSLEGLLRGDSAARSAFYSQMTQNGVLTRDECRRMERRPAMGGNAGVLTVQSNMLPIDKLGSVAPAATPDTPPPAKPGKDQVRAALAKALLEESAT